ncbi:MAG: 2-iminoacetate synthase ThiH, partial [Desulfobacula sp.]|nr:2-iminoacetate synthase ThiH [Desulfobacula sp.]
MSFLNEVERFETFDFENYFDSVTSSDIQGSLNRDNLNIHDLLNLLSKQAQEFLEPMAQKARRVTKQYFGRTIGLYAPLYISDFCSNHCTYCGFNTKTG